MQQHYEQLPLSPWRWLHAAVGIIAPIVIAYSIFQSSASMAFIYAFAAVSIYTTWHTACRVPQRIEFTPQGILIICHSDHRMIPWHSFSSCQHQRGKYPFTALVDDHGNRVYKLPDSYVSVNPNETEYAILETRRQFHMARAQAIIPSNAAMRQPLS